MADWVPMRGWGANVVLNAAAPSVDFVLVRHGSEEDPMEGTAGIVEHAEDILTQRVVGQVQLSASGDPVRVAMRIRTGLYDDNLDQAAFYATSLFNVDGAEEPFLWQRYVVIGGAVVNSWDIFAHPWWSLVDVRVARKLPRDQALFLSVEADIPGGEAEVTFSGYLRTYARALGS